jgi:hypothetical protein
MRYQNKFVKVFWVDALIYKSSSERPVLPQKMTNGVLIKSDTDYIILKDPKTFEFDEKLKMYYPDIDSQKQTYILIPCGMIKHIEKLKEHQLAA